MFDNEWTFIANMRQWPNAGLTLIHRLWGRTSIKPGIYPVFSGYWPQQVSGQTPRLMVLCSLEVITSAWSGKYVLPISGWSALFGVRDSVSGHPTTTVFINHKVCSPETIRQSADIGLMLTHFPSYISVKSTLDHRAADSEHVCPSLFLKKKYSENFTTR